MTGSAPQVFGLAGQPIAGSRSPALYAALFARFELPLRYLTLEVAREQGGQIGDLVRAYGLTGLNLTAPIKEAALNGLDGLAPSAAAAGAANAVVWEGGRLIGHNTDGEGLCRALEARGITDWARRSAVILGTGGAGRGVASALLGRGVGRLGLLNRSSERLKRAADAFGDRASNAPLGPDGFRALASGADLVINCTTPAAAPAIEALDPAVLGRGATWVDINYGQPTLPQQAACQALGVDFCDGLDMLVHQGLLAFQLFTGLATSADGLRAAVERP